MHKNEIAIIVHKWQRIMISRNIDVQKNFFFFVKWKVIDHQSSSVNVHKNI